MATATKILADYKAKRNFRATPEPGPKVARPSRKPIFVVQEHHASRLHYDFRLEADGVLKSWAVPKGPSMDPAEKRLAVQVEDHPLSYATFSGDIPEGQYGAGHVDIWDHGTYDVPPERHRSLAEQIEEGRVEFELHGEKLRGRFALIRMSGGRFGGKGGKKNWLLMKSKDEFAKPDGTRNEATAPPRKQSRNAPRATPSVPAGSTEPPPEVELTNGDKVWFPDDGITKGDVFHYYEKVADRLLPFLRNRPVTLERIPDGIGPGKPHFWQKHTPSHYPAWVPRVELRTERDEPVAYVVVNDVQTLLYLVNQGAITFHPWLSRVGNLDRPDFVLFDLDPGPEGFADAVEVARGLHKLLDAEGVESFPKTSGKRGIHVLVPWTSKGDYDEARSWAQTVARRAAEAMPERATVEVRKAKRGGHVYIDTLQNAKGHHAVPPYVVRPAPCAPVSMPLTWEELKAGLSPDRFTIKTVFRRLARQKSEPFARLVRAFQGPA